MHFFDLAQQSVTADVPSSATADTKLHFLKKLVVSHDQIIRTKQFKEFKVRFEHSSAAAKHNKHCW